MLCSRGHFTVMLCGVDICHDDFRVETLCAVSCLSRGFYSSGYAHPYPLWAACEEVAEVFVVEVVILLVCFRTNSTN